MLKPVATYATTNWKRFLFTLETQGILAVIRKVLRYPFIRLLKIKRKKSIFISSNIEDRFTAIYKYNYWEGSESVSGRGSSLEYTKNLQQKLPELFDKFSIKSVFDAPCGDFNWMSNVVEHNNITYIGADIVKPLIESNKKHNKNARARFLHFDITRHDFPQADLWICRDCLFHLSYKDTLSVLQRFIISDIPYILTTTNSNIDEFNNIDIATGNYREIDLFSEPYLFSDDVLFRIDDFVSPYSPREMCLWSQEHIIDAVEKFSNII